MTTTEANVEHQDDNYYYDYYQLAAPYDYEDYEGEEDGQNLPDLRTESSFNLSQIVLDIVGE